MLNATRFSAKSLGSTTTSRRLLWLRNLQADMRSKWQLGSAPYSAGNLFGPCLEPLLVETRDRRKILPPTSRRGDSHYSASNRYQSFRASDSSSFQQWFQHSYTPRAQLDSGQTGDQIPPQTLIPRGAGAFLQEAQIGPLPPLPLGVAWPSSPPNGSPLPLILRCSIPYPWVSHWSLVPALLPGSSPVQYLRIESNRSYFPKPLPISFSLKPFRRFPNPNEVRGFTLIFS